VLLARVFLAGLVLAGLVVSLGGIPVERAAILSDDGLLRPEHFALGDSLAAQEQAGLPTMAEAEREAIRAALEHFDGNRRKAAEHLGIGLRTLYDKLKRHGLT